jgi:hypothetical protein
MITNGDARLYGAAIAVVSGVYSIASSIGGGTGMMPMNDAVMVAIGIIVIVHGTVLLAPPLAGRLGVVSGPLMLIWAAIMLANQLLSATSDSVMASWDGGMVAVAVLMLASGVIMSRRGSM